MYWYLRLSSSSATWTLSGCTPWQTQETTFVFHLATSPDAPSLLTDWLSWLTCSAKNSGWSSLLAWRHGRVRRYSSIVLAAPRLTLSYKVSPHHAYQPKDVNLKWKTEVSRWLGHLQASTSSLSLPPAPERLSSLGGDFDSYEPALGLLGPLLYETELTVNFIFSAMFCEIGEEQGGS